MAARKGTLEFLGAYKSKKSAKEQERSHKRSFIFKRKIGSSSRFIVAKAKRSRKSK
jgi:hypothetical protein